MGESCCHCALPGEWDSRAAEKPQEEPNPLKAVAGSCVGFHTLKVYLQSVDTSAHLGCTVTVGCSLRDESLPNAYIG